MRTLRVLCAAALLLAAGIAARAQDRGEAGDELRLRAAGLAADGPALLEFFQQRTLGHVAAERLDALVRRLGDKDEAERGKAVRELVGLGPLAVPSLRLAASDPDNQAAANLARRCLAALRGEEAAELPVVAARVLARRRPAGAVAALLAYLPFADSGDVLEEVKNALGDVGFGEDGKPDPALTRALDDALPLRRAAAIDVLSTRLGAAPRPALRKLLADPKASVRLRAALALA